MRGRRRTSYKDNYYYYGDLARVRQLWFDKLLMIAINRYKIKILPKEIDESYFWRKLILQGYIIFFKDDIVDQYIALTGAIGGTLNVYGVPNTRNVIGENGYQAQLDEKNSVIIYSNYLHKGDYTISQIQYYAEMLTDIDMTIAQNLFGVRHPLVFKCDTRSRLTLENLFENYAVFKPVIYANKNFELADSLDCINTNVPYIVDKLIDDKKKLLQEYYEMLGVETTPNEKSERLITTEVNSALGATHVFKSVELNSINEGLNACNDMFGLNMKAEFNTDWQGNEIQTLLNGSMFANEQKAETDNINVGSDDK